MAALMLVVIALCAGCGLSLSETAEAPPAEGSARVTYLDAGQADATLIQSDKGHAVLIDTGLKENADALAAKLRRLGVESIDILVLTHGHADHMGGAITVMEAFPVKKIYISPQARSAAFYRKTLETIDRLKIPTEIPAFGTAFSVDDLNFTVVGPVDTAEQEKVNNSSIVLRMTHGNDAFLFPADAEKKEENDMMGAGATLTCDVLKVGHHGSKTSSSDDFLTLCGSRCKIAVISVGKDNEYGAPHDKTLKALNRHHMTVYRTDQNGDITVNSSGNGVTVTTEK
ncbi:MAG: MBL fold metallo-hydrolase [Eubacteriaceae bacterium]|nr:MBL fold metallo-hydrolase [Eubacteriaceae bacterium]